MKNKKSNEVLPWHFKNQIIMKNVILTAIVFLALGITTLVYVFKRGLNDEIVKAFTTGNVSTLSQYFAADISMVLLEESNLSCKISSMNMLQSVSMSGTREVRNIGRYLI